MSLKVLKILIKALFNFAGLEIHRRMGNCYTGSNSTDPSRPARMSRISVLEHAAEQGFKPAAVLDIGAAHGAFAMECARIFPGSRLILIDALEEHRPFLEDVTQRISNSEFILGAVGDSLGEVSINVHPDLVGSSILFENEDSDVNGKSRTVASITLDSLLPMKQLMGPILLKLDVQGAELRVLAGATDVLRLTEFIFMEVSFFQFFLGGPLFHEIIHFMKSKGFVTYDIADLQYRLLDDSLSQADFVFVREDNPLRKNHFYATRQQRLMQNTAFRSSALQLPKRS